MPRTPTAGSCRRRFRLWRPRPARSSSLPVSFIDVCLPGHEPSEKGFSETHRPMGECFQGRRCILSYLATAAFWGCSQAFRGWGGVGMAKLSDLFGRKALAGPDKLTGRPGGRNGNGGDPISIENLSDVGSRMGEENEVLRN